MSIRGSYRKSSWRKHPLAEKSAPITAPIAVTQLTDAANSMTEGQVICDTRLGFILRRYQQISYLMDIERIQALIGGIHGASH